MKNTSKKRDQVKKMTSDLLMSKDFVGLKSLALARPKLFNIDWHALEKVTEDLSPKETRQTLSILQDLSFTEYPQVFSGIFLEKAIRTRDVDLFKQMLTRRRNRYNQDIVFHLCAVYGDPLFLRILANKSHDLECLPKENTPPVKKINDVVSFVENNQDMFDLLVENQSFKIISFLEDLLPEGEPVIFNNLNQEKMNFLSDERVCSFFFKNLTRKVFLYGRSFDSEENIKKIVHYHVKKNESLCFHQIVGFVEKCYERFSARDISFADCVYENASAALLKVLAKKIPTREKLKNYPGHYENFEKILLLKSVKDEEPASLKTSKRMM